MFVKISKQHQADMKQCLGILVFFAISFSSFSQPIISGFSPASGPVGTSVTISGSGFNTAAANTSTCFHFLNKILGDLAFKFETMQKAGI